LHPLDLRADVDWEFQRAAFVAVPADSDTGEELGRIDDDEGLGTCMHVGMVVVFQQGHKLRLGIDGEAWGIAVVRLDGDWGLA
jgi:hypothetical protein